MQIDSRRRRRPCPAITPPRAGQRRYFDRDLIHRHGQFVADFDFHQRMKGPEKRVRIIRQIFQAIIDPHDVIVVKRDCPLESRRHAAQIKPRAKGILLGMSNFARAGPNFAMIGNRAARDLARRDGGEAIVSAAHCAGLKWIAGAAGKKPPAVGPPPHPFASAAAILEAQDFPAELRDDRNLDAGASQSEQFKAVERGLENG